MEVEGDRLVIKPEHNGGMFHFSFGSRGSAHFTVTVPQLNSASIAGSGDISVDRVAGQSFDGSVAGSGSLDVGALEVQQLKLSISGSGGIKASGGKAQTAEYEIGGSGDIDERTVLSDLSS